MPNIQSFIHNFYDGNHINDGDKEASKFMSQGYFVLFHDYTNQKNLINNTGAFWPSEP